MSENEIIHIRQILSRVTDPEIPVLTIEDMGILKGINISEDGTVEVTITPTYSGCPAMHAIEKEISQALSANGYEQVVVKEQLSPPWTTDWMSDEAREKLHAYGIAPPAKGTPNKRVLFGEQPVVKCPKCASVQTEMVSQFGSTACKALYRCLDCLEPFDYFKCI